MIDFSAQTVRRRGQGCVEFFIFHARIRFFYVLRCFRFFYCFRAIRFG